MSLEQGWAGWLISTSGPGNVKVCIIKIKLLPQEEIAITWLWTPLEWEVREAHKVLEEQFFLIFFSGEQENKKMKWDLRWRLVNELSNLWPKRILPPRLDWHRMYGIYFLLWHGEWFLSSDHLSNILTICIIVIGYSWTFGYFFLATGLMIQKWWFRGFLCLTVTGECQGLVLMAQEALQNDTSKFINVWHGSLC